MSMNRLRNIAVRMRPLADERPLRSEAQIEEPKQHVIVQPRRPNSAADPSTSRRQIWDLEADDTSTEDDRENDAFGDSAPSRRDLGLERSARQPVRPILDPLPDAAPASGRAKTRMLGFHVQDHETDAMGRVAATPDEPQFPAGFLVVIDGPGRGAYFAVSTAVSSIGRGADQDVALDFGDASISREGHASVVYDGEQKRFFLGHGNKANVVRRNGTPVLTTEELMHGDLIRIGKTSLRFHAFCDDTFTWDDADPASNARHAHE